MFEKILERILLTYFGKFITGFDQNNLKLGVWSGNVVIENVALKPEIITDLELLLQIKFSSIGRLILKIPWNKLSSAPVEVILEDILVVFNPLPEEKWNIDDSISAQKKFIRILEKAKQTIQNKKVQEGSGYFEKLTLKVIDNLQVSLKNIHFRFEDKSYSWGIKLDSLTALTTNEQFVPKFLDRTDQDMKLVPRNKLIELQSLQFYWNANETIFITEPTQQLNFDQVIQISAQCRLTINHKERFDKSHYCLDMELEQINLNLKHSQLKQIISLLEQISNYNNRIWSQRQQQLKFNSENHQKRFIDIFILFLKNDYKNMEQLDDEDDIKFLQQIIAQVNQKELQDWSNQATKKFWLERKVDELQKKKSQKKWFNFLGGNAQEEVTEAEVKQLEEFIQQEDTSKTIRPTESLKIKFRAKLKMANIQLVKDNKQLQDEGVLQQLEQIDISWDQFENKDFSFSIIIKNISLQLVNKAQKELICRPTQATNEFLKVFLVKTTNSQFCRLDLRFLLQSLTVNYNPSIVRIIREIIKVKQGEYVEQTLKTATWEQIEKIQDTTESSLKNILSSNIQIKVDVKILEPILELPINGNEFWLLKLKIFHIASKGNTSEDPYENFEIHLHEGSFEYFPERFGGKQLEIVHNYNTKLTLKRMKSIYVESMIKQNKPLILLNGRLEPFNMVMNEKVYKHLIYLPETIYPKQTEEQVLQQLQVEKQLILKHKTKSGFLKRCGTLIKTWSLHYVVLSQYDLFFYDHEQTLMATSQINLYNSILERLVVDDQLFAFKISNKSGEDIFACENERELNDWINNITEKIQQYQSFEAIKEKQTQIKKSENYFAIDISLKKLQFKLYKENNYPSIYQEYLLFLFKLNNLQFTYEKLEQQKQIIQIDNLSIQDWIFDYVNPQFQDLVLLSNSNENQPSLKLDIRSGVINIIIDIIHVNWKPDTFLKIRQLLNIIKDRKSRKWYFASVRDYEVDQLKRGSNCDYEKVKEQKLIDGLNRAFNKCQRYGQSKVLVKEKFMTFVDHQNFLNDYKWILEEILSSYQIKSNTKTIMELQSSITNVTVNFFHRTSHCLLFRCELEEVFFTFKKLQFSNYLDTKLNNISLYDMTNYPHTVDSNQEFHLVKPQKLLGKRDQYDDWVVRFRFSGYDEIIIANKDRVNMFLYIEINPVFAIYQHQPLMRQIDYIINQIVTLIREPDALTMNTEYIEQRKRNMKQHSLKAKRVWGDADDIQSKFICPTFIDLRISIRKPLAIVKGWPQFTEYFQLDCEVVDVYNKQYIDMSRLIKEGGKLLVKSNEPWMPDGRILKAWSEAYCIEGHNMQLQYYENGINQISSIFEFNLSFERALHYFEIYELYGDVQMDRSIRIRSAMSPIILKLFRKEYLEICKMIFHNFTNDDLKDKWYIHDFEVARSFEPAPISFWLDFFDISIFALSRKQENPLVQVYMKQLRLEWLKTNDIDLNLFGKQIMMYHYDDLQNEIGFVGDLSVNESVKLQRVISMVSGKQETQQAQQFNNYQFEGDFVKDLSQFQMLFHINKPSSDKECYIALKNVRMIVEPTIFFNVGLWSRLEQPCWPIQQEFGIMPSIKMIVEILNTSLCLQGLKSNQILATKGDISYVWNRSRFLHPEQMIINQKKGTLDKKLVEAVGDAFEHKINLKSLELFKCLYEDFVQFELKQIRKRHIILPFSLFFCIKNELQMNFEKMFIYFNNKYSFHIDKTICKFSYQDLVLIMSITEKLKSSKQEVIRESVYGLEETPNQNAPVNNIYDAIISGLQIVVINDAGEAYVPVFDLTLSETQLQFQQTNLKSIFSTVIRLSSSFYNPKIAIWEPILESCNFSVDVSLNPQGDPQKIIFIEMTQEFQTLNINLSAQMITVFHKTFLSWKQEIEETKKKRDLQLDIEEKQIERSYGQSERFTQIEKSMSITPSKYQQQDEKNENIDYVSPYTIRNETGFALEIYDYGSLNKKYLLQPNSSVNFEIDADFDQMFAKDIENIQQQQQRLVSIKVIHNQYQFDAIDEIDLDCIKVQRKPIKPINRSSDKSFMLFIEVVPKDTRKLLLISSETIIFNKTNKLLELKLFDVQEIQEINVLDAQIEPQRAFSVPLDRTRQYFSFRFEGNDKFSSQLDMRYLADNIDRKYEQSHNDYYTIITCSKRNINQSLIYLEAPFQIKNCLPMDISYELFGDQSTELMESLIIQQENEQSNITNVGKPLDKQQYEHLQLREKGNLSRQEQKQIHSISSKGRLAIKIKLPFYQISDICMLNHVKFGRFQIENFRLCDYRGNIGQVMVDQIQNVYYIYCKQIVINELPYKVFLYNTNEQRRGPSTLIAGQRIKDIVTDEQEELSNIVVLGDQQFISLSCQDNGNQLSEPINLNYTGNQSIKMQNETNQHVEVGYNISLMCVDKSKPLVTKALTISPRFVIINQTQNTIQILQEPGTQQLEIKQQCRKPLYWNSLKNQYISIYYQDEFIEWQASNPIDPNGAGFQCFTIRAVNNLSTIKHFNCISKIDNQITYLIILECKSIIKQMRPSVISEPKHNPFQVDPPYVIVNNLDLVTLTCFQYCCQEEKYSHRYQFGEYKQYVNNYQQCVFSWEYPCERRDLVIQLQFEGELSTYYKVDPFFINLEQAEAIQEKIITSGLNEVDQYKFYILSVWEGASRKLKFVQDVQNNQQQHDTNLLKLDINLNKVGVSLIDQFDNKRVELIYAYFQGLEFSLLETTQSRRSEFRVKYINIDNNTSYKTMFPVIFTPTKNKEIFEFNRSHLSLELEQSTQVKSVQLIKNFRACLQPTTIRLTSEMLEQLYSVSKQITQSFKTNMINDDQMKQYDFEFAIGQEEQQIQQVNSATLSNTVQNKFGIGSLGIINRIEWENVNITLNDQATYINKIEMYPLKFNLTFYNSANSNFQYNMLLQILKTIGIVLINIDEAPLILDGIFLENSFDTSSAIFTKLATHYKDMFIKIVLKLVGSIEIIGNPVGLVKHIAKGAYDLFDKPIEGFIKGPIEGGMGIAKGVGSALQNTISGVSNSASKIFGSISGGLAVISLDKQYKQQREQYKIIKPNQLFSGIYVGSKLLQISVQRAVIGVIDIPVQEAKRGGVKGLTIGVLEGTAGFFIKPFAGVFDFVSKTTDGLKATAEYWDDKANDKRTREIRTIYQNEQFYKVYMEKDAKVMQMLVEINVKFEKFSYYDSFEYEFMDKTCYLVLTSQQIINFEKKKKKIIWQIDSLSVLDIQLIDDGILYQLKEFNEKYKAQQVQLSIMQERQKEIIIMKSQWLLSNI